MARRPRIEFEGAIYHVAFRGNERREIFRDDTDRQALLARLAERVERYHVRLYLLKLSRYLHLNPVYVKVWRPRPLAERATHLQEYRWSSYRAYIGLARPEEFVDYGPVLAMMQSRKGAEAKAYRRYVEAGLAQTDDEFMEILKRSSIGIGSEAFLRGLGDRQASLSGTRVKTEDVAFRRLGVKRGAADIVKAVCEYYRMTPEELKEQRKRHWAKAVASKLLMRYAGLTQREVADWVGVRTGAAVCLQLRKLREDVGAATERVINRIEQILNI